MKKKLPEWISRLLPLSLICTLINLFIFYALSYWISTNGITTTEMYLFLIMPSFSFLAITSITCYFLLKQYRLQCFEDNKKPYPGWLISILLMLFIFLSGIMMDWIYYQVDPYLSKDFGETLSNMLTSVGESKETLDQIAKLPLFTQNYVGIGIGIFIGVIIAVTAVTLRVKKPMTSITPAG
jgi:hypothetical protein